MDADAVHRCAHTHGVLSGFIARWDGAVVQVSDGIGYCDGQQWTDGISIDMPLPSEFSRLDAELITGLQAEVEIAGVGTYPLTVNPADDSVSGSVTDIPSGSQNEQFNVIRW